MKNKILITFLTLISFSTIIFASSFGAAGSINLLSEIFNQTGSQVLLELRIPRALLGFIVGSGLAMSGVVLQTFFRNDLCSPYTLGISSFASLGAVIAIFLNLSAPWVQVAASVGALAALGILLLMSFGRFLRDTSTILLVGIALSLGSSSLITLFQHLGGPDKLFEMTKWLEGGIEILGFSSLVLPIVALTLIIVVYFSSERELNLIQVSFEYARGRGVNIERTAFFLIVPTSIFIGIVTSICGPIGFVGLIVPHIARTFTGANHRALLYVSFLIGGGFLVLMDLISRLIIAPAELPVGILCGVVGTPFFLGVLVRKFSRHK